MGILARMRAAFGAGEPELTERSAYEAGAIGRLNHGWGFGGGGPTATQLSEGKTLRDRARDGWRNQPLLARGAALLVGRALGESGIHPRFSTLDDDGLARAARDAWREWGEVCDHTGTLGVMGVQHQMLQALYVDGGSLCRFWFRAHEPGLVPLTLQPMELDHLSEWSAGPMIMGGVETDASGRVLAYHLRREHPEESWWRPDGMAVDRIEAREIAHLHMGSRPGQLLGVSAFHAVLAPTRYLDDAGDADLVRWRAQATLAAIVHGAVAPMGTGRGRMGESTLTDASGEVVEVMRPGSIVYTDADKVTLTHPTADAGMPASIKQWHHLIAVGMGVQYHDLVGDLSAVNYSSYRAGHIVDRQNTMVDLSAYVRPRLLVPMWRRWREASQAVDRSFRRLPRSIEWTPPMWRSVDPLKDAKADQERIRAGLDSLSRTIEATGCDPGEVFASLASDRDVLSDLGLWVSTVLTGPSASDTPQGAEA